jgi:glycosyltransferase involved in cell wall biosynthesis
MTIHRQLDMLGRVEAFVAPSQSMANALIAFGCKPECVHTIPSFVSLERFKPVTHPERTYVLYFGRLDIDKGVEVLVKAWARLGSEAPPLRIVGSGTAEASIRGQVQALGLSTVQFFDHMSGEQLLNEIQHAAFVIVPSIWQDNSPMSVYESLACGKPVIGSDIGGISAQVIHGQTGYLVQPGNNVDLADKVVTLWKQPSLIDAMSFRARQIAETEFSPEVHWAKLGSIFQAAVDARKLRYDSSNPTIC